MKQQILQITNYENSFVNPLKTYGRDCKLELGEDRLIRSLLILAAYFSSEYDPKHWRLQRIKSLLNITSCSHLLRNIQWQGTRTWSIYKLCGGENWIFSFVVPACLIHGRDITQFPLKRKQREISASESTRLRSYSANWNSRPGRLSNKNLCQDGIQPKYWRTIRWI